MFEKLKFRGRFLKGFFTVLVRKSYESRILTRKVADVGYFVYLCVAGPTEPRELV